MLCGCVGGWWFIMTYDSTSVGLNGDVGYELFLHT